MTESFLKKITVKVVTDHDFVYHVIWPLCHLTRFFIFPIFQVLGPYTFKIGDTRGFTAYKKGGICTQVKMPTVVTFKSLPEALEEPSELFMLTDFGKFDRPGQLHLAFQTMNQFKKETGRHPKPWSTEDATQFKEMAQKLNKEAKNPVETLDDDLIETFAKH